jgi:hypothetical protein
LWSRTRPAKGDLWAYADRVDYESGSDDPRVLQARIDALRARPARQGQI